MTGRAANALRALGLIGVLAGASVQAGCAVMTVDVDVYKGPLANDHDVQIEQMAVMAVGAERLLAQLDRNMTQDFLINSGGRLKDGKTYDEEQAKKRKDQNYISPQREIFRYVDDAQPYCTGKKSNDEKITTHPQVAHKSATGKLIGRKNSMGERKNEGNEADLYRQVALISDIKAVRCLYYDLSDEKKKKITEVRKLAAVKPEGKELARTDAALGLKNILEDIDREAKKLERALKIYRSDPPSARQQDLARRLRKSKIPGSVQSLARAYQLLLAPPVEERQGLRIWGAIFFVLRTDSSVQKKLGIKKEDILDPIPRENPLGTSAVLGFEALRNQAMLESHAKFLFPDDMERQKTFVNEIVRIADSYFNARDALKTILERSLEGLSTSGFTTVLGAERYREFVSGLARGVPSLIDVESLGVLLTIKGNSNVDKLKKALKNRLAKTKFFPKDGVDVKAWTNANREPIEAALRGLLIENPDEWAKNLQELNNVFKRYSFPNAWRLTIPYAYKDSARRKFGLALGPGEERPGYLLDISSEGYEWVLENKSFKDALKKLAVTPREKVETEQAQQASQGKQAKKHASEASEFADEFLRPSTSTLGRGRLKPGLFTRIERYLKSKEQDIFKSKVDCFKRGDCNLETLGTVKEEREALSVALIRFAEKVLPLANNIGLFSEIGSRRGNGASNISAYGETEQFESSRTGGNNAGDRESRDTYVRVLQTVGNSIQVFADAIKKKEKHDKKLVKSAEAEARAILRVFDGGPAEIYDRVLAGVKADHDSLEAANQEVADARKAVAAADKALKAEVNKFNALAPGRDELEKLEKAWKALGRNPQVLGLKTGFIEKVDRDLKTKIDGLKLPPGGEGVEGLYVEIRKAVMDAFEEAIKKSDKLLMDRLEAAVNQIFKPDFQKAVLAKKPATEAKLRTQIYDEIVSRHGKAKKAYKNATAEFKARKGVFAKKAKEVNKAEKTLEKKNEKLKNAKDAKKKFSSSLKDAFDLLKRADVRKAVLHEVEVKAYREPLGRAVHRETITVLQAMVENNCVLPAKFVIAAGTDAHERKEAPVPQADPKPKVTKAAPPNKIDKGAREKTETLSIPDISSTAKSEVKKPSGTAKAVTIKTSAASTAKEKCQNAIQVIESRPAPSEPSSALVKSVWLGNKMSPNHCATGRENGKDNPCKEEKKTAKDIFDEMISILRHKHLRAVEDSGPGSGPAGRAAAALVEAYRQRANMIYIRPALAYLRTSFTASTLLDNKKAWKNLLENHGYRAGLPYFPERLDKIKKKIDAEIDTQFWQNINRVQVSGVGETNYVIAKDDIGNWYVKSFSADVSDITKAAKNLALFAAGGAISAPGGLREGPDGQPVRRETTLQRQLRRFKEKHIQELRGILVKANTGAKSLPARILDNAKKTEMKDDTDGLEALEKIVTPSDNDKLTTQVLALDTDGIKEKDVPEKVTDVFAAIRSYHSSVVGNISTSEKLMAKTSAKPEEAKTDRRQIAKDSATLVIIGSELKQLVQEAQDSLRNYVTAILFIGDSVRSELNEEPLPGGTPKLPAAP